MRSARVLVGCLLLLAGAGACTVSQPAAETQPAPQPKQGRSPAATLGVPPGQLPPPGQCRVWVPGKPPGHQAKARTCDGIERSAAAGTWILYRPGKDKKVVHVKEIDSRRSGVIVRLRIYDAQTGSLIGQG
jgi:hypothetical protein